MPSDPEAPVAGETDTSSEAVERLAVHGLDAAGMIQYARGAADRLGSASLTGEVFRVFAAHTEALVAERDAAIARAEAAEARASEHGAYRTAASAFIASRGLSAEFDAWLDAGGLEADAVGRLVDVARAARNLRPMIEDHYEPSQGAPLAIVMDSSRHLADLGDTLDALPPGILDQSPESEG